ncbi:hypothetical protein GCM10020256_64120 [Streptomyces thermocoprophilus]
MPRSPPTASSWPGSATRSSARSGAASARTAWPPSASSASTPVFRGHGIGARLLRAVETALTEERGAKLFRLRAGHRSEGNLRLYRRVGYQRVDTVEGADGVRMIVLEKAAGAYAATA